MAFKNYRNGNYVVYFDTETGDKIRSTRGDKFIPAFAENCDVTITNACDGGCPFCYMGCTPNGQHGKLDYPFLDSLHPYTELAINGNDLSHPDLIPFLERMKEKQVVVNMTVNQIHFERHFELIQDLQEKNLIHGVGVSLVAATNSFVRLLQTCKNTIVHVINGIFKQEDAIRLMGHNFDILILGYKTTCRGKHYLNNNDTEIFKNQNWLKNNILNMFSGFKTVEFDNLALEQLSMQEQVSNSDWDTHYMGDDGDFTFFINLVDGYFAKNSTSSVHYPLMDSVDEMFRCIQGEKDYV